MTFSIVIPAYNGDKYIERAIRSALNQTRKPNEIIVHDDNSTDYTRHICEKYIHEIVYYLNPDGPSGFVNGWNKSIVHAKSDFIAILHQDDLLYPTFLQEAEYALRQNPDVRHFFAICDYIDDKDNIINSAASTIIEGNYDEKIVRYTGREYLKTYQKNYHGIPHIHRCPGVITHRTIFEAGCNYNPDAGHIADDDFFYRVGQFTDVIGILKPLAAFRIHKSSETGSIGDPELSLRLANDYLFQIKQWKSSSFLDSESKYYFIKNALKFKRRLLGYGLKHNNLTTIQEALTISAQLKKENYFEKSIRNSILEKLLSIKITSFIVRKLSALIL